MFCVRAGLVVLALASCTRPSPPPSPVVQAPTTTAAVLPVPSSLSRPEDRPARGELWVTQAWLDEHHVGTQPSVAGVVPRSAVFRIGGQADVFVKRRTRPDGRMVIACMAVEVLETGRPDDVGILPGLGPTEAVVVEHAITLVQVMPPLPSSCVGSPQRDEWALVGQSRGAEAYVERTLYEKPGGAHFFVHVLVVNQTAATLGLDLERYFGVLYANQWGASATPLRGAIDETRMPVHPLDDVVRARLLEAFRRQALTPVPGYGAVDYYRDFNASTRAEVDAQSQGARFVLLAMDGAIDVTDGTNVDRILVPSDDAAREVAIEVPVPWKPVPPSAKVLVDL